MSQSPRDVPWERLIRFHKEICRRAEESFFSLPAGDSSSERWSSLNQYEPSDLIGPWSIPVDALVSDQLLSRIKADDSLEVVLGGPCWFAWKKQNGSDWYLDWRPVLYREVRVEFHGDHLRLVPLSGNWDISPLVFELLEKRQVSSSAPLEESLAQILENIQRLQSEGHSTTRSAIETLSAYSVEIGDELRKATNDFPQQKVRRVPSSWVLFSPPRAGSTSAYTQYILKDYGKLEALLAEDAGNVGGLGLLTDSKKSIAVTSGEILPIVPLNPSQLSAVEAVFKARPVTVISGPPGCGKSQVVLSLLLNAWSQGVSVLFASNNNQAVDVVRQRLETFENDIPIAIRAGAKRFNNIEESLRRSLNVISALEAADEDQLPKLKRKQSDLRRRRDAKRSFLGSELPDRVDQAVGAGITSYANARALRAERDSIHAALVEELARLNYRLRPEQVHEKLIVPFRLWIDDVQTVARQIDDDSRLRQELTRQLIEERQNRDTACARVGLNAATVTTWTWLQTLRQMPDLFEHWWEAFKSLALEPIEEALRIEQWDKRYESWTDAANAESWLKNAKGLAEEIRSTVDRTSARVTELIALEASYIAATERLRSTTSADVIEGNFDLIDKWIGEYATLCSMDPGSFDWLPWSSRSRRTKTLTGIESQFRSMIPLAVWKQIGSLNDVSRGALSEILEVVRGWNHVKARWDNTLDERTRLADTFDRFRQRARESRFKPEQLPAKWNGEEWRVVANEIDRLVVIATDASVAWRHRDRRMKLRARISVARADFFSIGSGSPIKEAWLAGVGSPLAHVVDQWATEPTFEVLARVRAEVYEERPRILIDAWRQAVDSEERALDGGSRLKDIPGADNRLKAWQANRPRVVAWEEPVTELPGIESGYLRHLKECEEWGLRWDTFRNGPFVDLSRRVDQERSHAIEMIEEGLEMVPVSLRTDDLITIVEQLKADSNSEWDIIRLRKGFEQFSPGKIRADLEKFDSDLQSVSFHVAKLEWQKRVADDSGLQDAMRDLRSHYQRNRGEVKGDGVALFERVLRGQPVWITTALSGQSIPMQAGLFDLVVIDEATQCTLTNLLPLIYRAKRLVVIGDPEQLPAIGSIGLAAERGLAEKYQVTEWLTMLGHADNDIYKCCVASLPRRQADVITLSEHYRSHPLIIGFSNQYIYRKSLRLRKDPSQVKDVPLGSGVVGINVSGSCSRTDNSWLNGAERDAVVGLIQQIRSDPLGAGLSIGVVTPFRSQATAIEKKLEQLDLGIDVTVDTVHGYQGDERDVMIFSPVVSRGINPAAAKWVETPKNLINVAVTRAREALFFVADFNECRKQQGILGQFTRYAEKINLLRQTSAEELQLFGWIVMQGMMPEIHPRIRDIEVDFVLKIGGVRLAIEVDGEQHELATTQDAARDAFLVGAGYRVLRVKARDVRDAPAVVLARIGKALELQEDVWDFAGLETLNAELDPVVD